MQIQLVMVLVVTHLSVLSWATQDRELQSQSGIEEVWKTLALSGCEMRDPCEKITGANSTAVRTTSIQDMIGPPITHTQPTCCDAATKEQYSCSSART
jgi:hypothetical protein